MFESLLISFSFVLLSLILIFKEKLGIGKEIFVAELLALVQLFILGYIIVIVFDLGIYYAGIMILFMISVSAFMVKRNVTKEKNRKIVFTAFLSNLTIAIIALTILTLSKTILFEVRYLIPLMGMVIGGSTNAMSIGLERFLSDLKSEKDVLWGYLALGATEKQSVHSFVKKAVRAALTPHLNSTRAVGLIFIPGAMVGMLLAGTDPLEAAKIQITIMWMIMSSNIFSVTIACYLLYKEFIYQIS
ncbi:ABC transporter permease [Methanococcus maripaludis]|uniref:Putative ABC transport system permease protein n=1 Tax=Methanococcus maripaludis TaxID=39152 RepID=A0A7J9PH00_METMI|nr:iron export ABC transporter permease subunit FetB [Methanococcus maripaludis]MBA2862493.1 putative ABC transport system permease protein [Methanococcus maripaludis]